ncbi:hypothetical protein HY497_00660 [Candidatus Woesearchaeota archaeon]|nr:hypothetical protein [Candidatus Woesearchaeota archaeon]
MKRTIILAGFILVLCSVLVAAAPISQSKTPIPMVTLLSQEPDPAEPGEIVTLKFKIQNNGTVTEDDVNVELLTAYPFSLYSGKGTVNIGQLRAGQTGADAAIVEFKVKVDEEAVERGETVDVVLTYGKIKKTFEDFTVSVRTRDVVLDVAAVKTVPELVAPGTEFRLEIVLRNSADSLIRNVNAKMNLSGSGIPFAPDQSGSEGYVYQINPKTQKSVSYELIALPNADGGVYKIPLTLTYTDETGSEIEKDDLISLKISSAPELLAVIDSSTITQEQRSGTVSVRIVNRGLTDIKLLTAALQESEDYSLAAEPYVYVGNIDSDDYETADFDIALQSYDKIVEFPIKLTYRDVTNKEFSEEVVLKLKTQSKGLILTIISGIFSVLVTATAAILAVLGAYWLYSRRKKRREG